MSESRRRNNEAQDLDEPCMGCKMVRHSLTHLLTHSLTHSLIHTLLCHTYTYTHTLINFPNLPLHCLFILTHLLTHSLTHTVTHLLTHSLTPSQVGVGTCTGVAMYMGKLFVDTHKKNKSQRVFLACFGLSALALGVKRAWDE